MINWLVELAQAMYAQRIALARAFCAPINNRDVALAFFNVAMQ
jgi:hypothetical protein